MVYLSYLKVYFQNTVESAYKSPVGESKSGSYIRMAPLSELCVKQCNNWFLSTFIKYCIHAHTYINLFKEIRDFTLSTINWSVLFDHVFDIIIWIVICKILFQILDDEHERKIHHRTTWKKEERGKGKIHHIYMTEKKEERKKGKIHHIYMTGREKFLGDD